MIPGDEGAMVVEVRCWSDSRRGLESWNLSGFQKLQKKQIITQRNLEGINPAKTLTVDSKTDFRFLASITITDIL